MYQKICKFSTLIQAAITTFAIAVGQIAVAQTTIDVWDTSDPNNWDLVAQIEAIRGAQTGAQHYDWSRASGEPVCVNYGPRLSNLWVHENTNATDDLTFGFIFNTRGNNAGSANIAKLKFRIVDSANDTGVVVSDDPGEAVETPSGSDAFVGNYSYNNANTDGIAVGGISGGNWTIIIDSVDFGNITNWFAASGGESIGGVCNLDLADFELTKGSEYRLTPEGNTPSGAPVDATLVAAVAGPDQSVEGNDLVTLDGSASSPLDQIYYSWSQVGGTDVVLSGADSANPTFQAPNVAGTLTFSLTVEHKVTAEVSEADLINVLITIVDRDGDGVADDEDAYPDDPDEWADDDGNGIGDNLDVYIAEASADCAADARNHGQYVSCVAKVLNVLLEDGEITEEQKDMLQSIAAESDIGKSNKGKKK